MKIAVIKKNYSSQGGGAERYTRMVCESLAAKGHDVFVLSETFDAEKTDRIDHILVPSPALSMPSSSGTMAFHRRVRRLLDSRSLRQKPDTRAPRFDVVYALSRTFPVDVFRATEQIHADWLCQSYSPAQRLNPRHRGILWLEEKIYDPANTKAVVTNSSLAKKLISSNFKFPEDRLHVIRNGVDRRTFRPADIDEKKALRRDILLTCAAEEAEANQLLVLFAAGNFRIKGLDYAIRALREAEAASGARMRLLVVGDDKPGPYVKLAAKLGLWDRVHFLGGRRDMRSCYAAADILLLPSLGEPFANVCLEACACALPVITTERNGSSELIQDGTNGFIIKEASDIGAIAARLSQFANFSPGRRLVFADAALRASATYTWESHIDSLEALLLKSSKNTTTAQHESPAT